jgi:thiamine transporter ThiT
MTVDQFDQFERVMEIVLDHGRWSFRWGVLAGFFAGFVAGVILMRLLL